MKLGIIGFPVEHSLSPRLHQLFFAADETGGEYLRYPLSPVGNNFELFVRGPFALSHQGFNVTYPFKERAAGISAVLSPAARLIGCVNTLIRRNQEWEGHNTDGWGFCQSLEEAIGIGKEPWILIGAGGAGRACALEMATRGIPFKWWSRTKEKMLNFLNKMNELKFQKQLGEDSLADSDPPPFPVGIINATPLGLEVTDPLPFPESWQGGIKRVVDMNYRHKDWALPRWCLREGISYHDGRSMLFFQGLRAHGLFRDFHPEKNRVRTLLNQFLAQDP